MSLEIIIFTLVSFIIILKSKIQFTTKINIMNPIIFLSFIVLFNFHGIAQNVYDLYLPQTNGIIYTDGFPTSDGGFILCGQAPDSSNTLTVFYVKKFDLVGHSEWGHQYSSMDPGYMNPRMEL